MPNEFNQIAVRLLLAAVCLTVPFPSFSQSAFDDLSTAHDYATVDIATLSTLELTFVPENRKKEIFNHIFSDVKWSPRPGISNARQCPALLSKLTSWSDIEIVEPTIRANAYGAPAFSEWRSKCPKLTPHEDRETIDGRVYGTHDFKVFTPPALLGKKDVALFYYQGNEPEAFIDRLGQLRTSNYTYDGTGKYRFVDLSSCKIAATALGAAPEDFSYYKWASIGSIAEGVVIKSDKDLMLVTATRISGTKAGFLAMYDLSTPPSGVANSLAGQDKKPACEFDATFP